MKTKLLRVSATLSLLVLIYFAGIGVFSQFYANPRITAQIHKLMQQNEETFAAATGVADRCRVALQEINNEFDYVIARVQREFVPKDRCIVVVDPTYEIPY